MNNITMVSNLFRQIRLRPTLRNVTCNYSAKKADTSDSDFIKDDEEKEVNVAEFIVNSDEIEDRTAYIMKIRNKSGLLAQDKRRLLHKIPYDEPQSWVHLTVAYQRKMYARYGAVSGVDPRIMFSTADDLADENEYERVAYPKTLQQMVIEEKLAAEKKLAAKRKRDEEIDKKMAKLDQWTNELNARVDKKEADTRAAKEKRERLIEDVRRQFGFRLDHRDPRFKELLEQKELEDKKASKALKKQKKQEIALKKLQEHFEDKKEEPNKPESI